MYYTKIALLLAIIALLPFSLAACDLTLNTVNSADLLYKLMPDASAEILFIFTADYTEQCIIDEFNPVDMDLPEDINGYQPTLQITSEEVPCPEKFKSEVANSLGNFLTPISCSARFTESGKLRITISGASAPLGEIKDNSFEIKLSPNSFSGAKKNTSLSIAYPTTLTLTDYSKEGAYVMLGSILSWSPIPAASAITASFTLPSTPSSNYMATVMPLIVVLVIGLAVIIAISVLFLKRFKPVKVDKAKQLAELKDKIKILEQSYITRKIDETTYRRLFEQYQFQMNELALAIRKEDKNFVQKPQAQQKKP